MLELVIRLVFSLAVVLGLLALLAKFGARRFRGGKDSLVQVVHRQHISRGAAVSVVCVGNKVLVLGTTEHQVRVLTELDPSEIAEELSAGEVLALVPQVTDVDDAKPTFVLPETVSTVPAIIAPRPAGTHRAAAAKPAKGGRRAARPEPKGRSNAAPQLSRNAAPQLSRNAAPQAGTGALSGSVLSADTWKQAFAAASRRAS